MRCLNAFAMSALAALVLLAQNPAVAQYKQINLISDQRFVLADTDGRDESWLALPAALASGEPQLAIRAGRKPCASRKR